MASATVARLVAARAHRDLSDLARLGVGTISSEQSCRERIEAARRLRVLANELVDLVVLAEALGGATWQEITKALQRRDAATVQAEYEDDVQEWQSAPAEPFDGIDDAQGLDAWYRVHREDSDPPAENPVSDLLRMG
ncbi:hypothetical protein [Streptomyces sp. NPDC059003]|uniref:hypothetical protein n=1 Tax=Streptomyces sp. NPDC059003 TaxID=3346691 RepID=UPI003675D544